MEKIDMVVNSRSKIMKKLIIAMSVIFLAGCAEKKEYEQAVLEQMNNEKDIKDYNIDPQTMMQCVVQTTSNKMPGLIFFDPTRRQAYKNYSVMLNLTKTPDPQKSLEELRQAFGSAKGLADAHSNYTESMLECLSGLVTSEEEPK
jgi:hypothetical protein